MNAIQVFNYQSVTNLPLELQQKADQSSPILVVQTPHKSTVIIDLKENRSGMLTAPRQLYKSTKNVISELVQLEFESKDYLLKAWKDLLTK